MNRVLILGLDGASPHLVRQWRDSLPSLSRLMQEGASGTLWSVIPPRSVPAWYCFATGMNPAKLGVFGFSQRRPGTYDYTFANFSFCQAPPFWEWLNARGITTGIVHMPGTFPPRPLKGFLVSGWPAPLNRGNLVYTYPPQVATEVDRFLGKPLDFVSPGRISRDNDGEMLRERVRMIQQHGEVAFRLLRGHSWQVALVVLSPLDRASHQFWRHMGPQHPRHDPSVAVHLGAALKETYQAVDGQLARLLSLVDRKDWVFLVSDHGFGPQHRVFYLNEWLLRQRYLILRHEREQLGRVRWPTRLVGHLASPLFGLNLSSSAFRQLAAPFKKRALSNFLRDQYVLTKERGLVRLNHLPVDWRRTRAYSPDAGGLYLNLRGRDPEGIVAPGEEARRLLNEIEEGLRRMPDPATGEPVPVRLYRKEEIYSGPFLEDAPDLWLTMDDHRTHVMAELGSGDLFDLNPLRSGAHTSEGVFAAVGPGIPGGLGMDAGLMDIAPTVSHLMGVPIPENVDGHVLHSLFREDSEFRHRRVGQLTIEASRGAGEAYSPEEQAQVEKQLRDLGYLG